MYLFAILLLHSHLPNPYLGLFLYPDLLNPPDGVTLVIARVAEMLQMLEVLL